MERVASLRHGEPIFEVSRRWRLCGTRSDDGRSGVKREAGRRMRFSDELELVDFMVPHKHMARLPGHMG